MPPIPKYNNMLNKIKLAHCELESGYTRWFAGLGPAFLLGLRLPSELGVFATGFDKGTHRHRNCLQVLLIRRQTDTETVYIIFDMETDGHRNCLHRETDEHKTCLHYFL